MARQAPTQTGFVSLRAISIRSLTKGGSLTTPERVRTLIAGNGTDVFGHTPERAVLANRGSEPLVLLTASVVSTSGAEATPETP
jgi:hypothetical protein